MLRKRRVLTIVLVLTIVAIVGAMVLSACQIKLNNPIVTPEDPTPNNPIVTPDNPTPDNPIVTPDPDPTPDPEPDVPVIEQKTEAEYKAMFEADLPGVIENCFNKNVINEKFKLKNIKVLAYNNLSGTFYINCDRNNTKSFYEVSNDNFKNQTSYKTLYEEIQNGDLVFNFGEQKTSQEEGLANEIAEFAFEQAEVQNYLSENGIDASNYEVLNATEFESSSQGRFSKLTIKMNNKIFNCSIGGSTGSCSTQRDYLNVLKSNEVTTKINIQSLIEYKELTVA